MNNIIYLNKWLIYYILSFLNYKNIIKFLITNKKFHKLFNDEKFWVFIIRKQYPNQIASFNNKYNYYSYVRLSRNIPQVHYISFGENSMLYTQNLTLKYSYCTINNSNTFIEKISQIDQKNIKHHIIKESNGNLLENDILIINRNSRYSISIFDGIEFKPYDWFSIDTYLPLNYWYELFKGITIYTKNISRVSKIKVKNYGFIFLFIYNSTKYYIFFNEEISTMYFNLHQLKYYNIIKLKYIDVLPSELSKTKCNISNTFVYHSMSL